MAHHAERRLSDGRTHTLHELLQRFERIKCPQCGTIQDAEVLKTIPWFTYIHTCEKCDYAIMESEWNRVDNNEEN